MTTDYTVRQQHIQTKLDTIKERGALGGNLYAMLCGAVKRGDRQVLDEMDRAADSWFKQFGKDARKAS